jgi:uncharacterized protein (TIGR02118 family)
MKTKISLLLVAISLVSAFQQNKSTDSPKIEKGMIKVSVFYPAGEGKTFDWDYYFTKHVPMVKSLLGDSVKVISIDKGIGGRTPGSPAPYVAMFHMYFKTITAYQNSFGPSADKIRKDIPNYTNIQPEVQISEVQQ